jgi:aldose 1-epimerase
MANDAALRPFAPGELIHIGNDRLRIEIAPQAGGRIAQIAYCGVEWLCGYADDNVAMIAWGSYPMLPWAGRIRHGKFDFQNRQYQLPNNLGAHAIHGIGFALPWRVELQQPHAVELSLSLPNDERWPFGGSAHQRIEIDNDALLLQLSVTAGEPAMPKPVIGWHPWFRKPTHLDFAPESFYPRDMEGIAALLTTMPPPGPWDDCFINHKPVVLQHENQTLRLTSNCNHWVVYDQPAHATCVEPQTGPPDAFNLLLETLQPNESVSAWFRIQWRR